MAPNKGQSRPGKAASGHVKKQTIVPAIPLPLMPKQPAKRATSSQPPRNTSNGFPASSLEAALIDRVPDADQSAKTSKNEVNGSGVEKSRSATASATSAPDAAKHDPVPLQTNGNTNLDVQGPVDAVTAGNPRVGEQQGSNPYPHMSRPPSRDDLKLLHLITVPDRHGHVYVSQPSSATSSQITGFPPPALHTNASVHPNPISADRFHNPAAFHAPQPIHHAHQHPAPPRMSNGAGIMFGGFGNSHTPSPVPPHGGFMPPPPPPQLNGDAHIHPRVNGHRHAHSNSNGFRGAVNTPIRPDMMPMSTVDGFPPIPAHMPHAPFEPFTPGGMGGRYGPPTPHSFHGSNASGEPNNIEVPHGPYPHNGHHFAAPVHPHTLGHLPPFMNPEHFPRRVEDDFMDSVSYYRNQFDNGELSDCVLELVSTSGRHHPLKIKGHKLVLARSPVLKKYITAAQASELGSHTITIESDDPYLQSDAWWTAVQRLYMHPLLSPPPIVGNSENGMNFAGNELDRFRFCLGYAAAGHTLNMRDILVRGLEIASSLLTWDTIEEALSFTLEGTTQRHVTFGNDHDQNEMDDIELDFGYGPDTRNLLGAILVFLITNFPSNFELDTTVVDPPMITRLPAFAPMFPPTDNTAPAIARGTNMRNPAKPHRLTSIKFGDLPTAYPEDEHPSQQEPAKCSPILSRILLNLPFRELCIVLTSGSQGVAGWNTASERYHAVADVVAEREARRLRAVEAVRAGAVPHAQDIQYRLTASRPHPVIEHWDVLNWKEEVARPTRGVDVPGISRRWVPQFSAVQETPQSQNPMHGNHASMV
ncbi:hypothetical protein F4778DRAFT_509649 [Xylariomycetidae sp. FL2044]|nr:hypothetical protein F4778DRAFT_509649 [Xylariomycetidae sp. FL2044]